MSGLSSDDLDIVADLLGTEIACTDAAAIAASVADLRASLPEFRRSAAELVSSSGQPDE